MNEASEREPPVGPSPPAAPPPEADKPPPPAAPPVLRPGSEELWRRLKRVDPDMARRYRQQGGQ